MNKTYLNIREVSNLLNIEEHIIRYWDSIDPKTKKLRIEGISTRTSKGGNRYFSKENIQKLEILKKVLFENGEPSHYSLNLAKKIISSKKTIKNFDRKHENMTNEFDDKKLENLIKILNKMRTLIKK
tara:strand:- start:30 stop:410 length:381 start_codon:yes stop_codon:yes gene_type:complete